MKEVLLPKINKFDFSLFDAIEKRKSIRNYKNLSIDITHLSYLLWSAKMVPSAGALYPLEFYTFCKFVNGLDIGLYRYEKSSNKLIKISDKDILKDIYEASLYQDSILKGALLIFIVADFNVTMRKYKERGKRYVFIEAGHSSQNIYLMATALNLGTVAIGAFIDSEIKKILNLPKNEDVIYIMPVGKI